MPYGVVYSVGRVIRTSYVSLCVCVITKHSVTLGSPYLATLHHPIWGGGLKVRSQDKSIELSSFLQQLY